MRTAPSEPHAGSFEAAARALAETHALADGPGRQIAIRRDLRALRGWCDRVREAMTAPAAPVAKAAEWWLDNEYVVRRAITQVSEDLPSGFYERLPALAGGESAGVPRVIAVGRTLLSDSRLQLSLSTIVNFVEAYQVRAPLTIAELWALPTVLRLACLEVLIGAVGRLVPRIAPPCEIEAPEIALDDTECVARALGNLRSLAAIPWRKFFQRTSQVEHILRRDPGKVYEQLDFETADRYRRVVEELAQESAHSELDVAERVVDYAQSAAGTNARLGHVGHWLIGDGREAFEESLRYRVSRGLRLRRFGRRHAVACYTTAVVATTLGTLLPPAAALSTVGASAWLWALGMAVALVPASVVAMTAIHWGITQVIPPSILPKLDFRRGIPTHCKTCVVVPALAGSGDEARELVDRLERHYLANPDPNAEFVLLTDHPDAPVEQMDEDRPVLDALQRGVEDLNQSHGSDDSGPFHLLHRVRRFNAAEGCWMGWERKRGKLEQLNGLLLGSLVPDFALHVGSPERLKGVRFVVTLDADTQLPRDCLTRLVGTLAHPLNRAEFDEQSGRVRAGYTVIQPRIEIDPASCSRSRFARWFAGDTAIDIYSRAVSDVYQDLFGTGIYVGKGIYDVETFHRSLEGRIPENALASHDLLEGIHGRAALATDIVLYESFPTRYLEFTRRMHRWIRGDWQLLPWVGRRVPGRGEDRMPNRLAPIDRWKILDNLRRSLVAPALIAMLAAGWLTLPGSAWFWTVLGVLAPAAHLFTDLVTGLGRGARRNTARSTALRLWNHGGRWALLIVFLPFEALNSLDAIVRSLVRVAITRRHMLQWKTAARTAREVESLDSRAGLWRRMWIGPTLATGLAVAILLWRSSALPAAAPLLALWFASPQIAHFLGRARRRETGAQLSAADQLLLRRLARRTWLYFESFAGPLDQWLPPDNVQEDPRGEIAHRTSPTNVGMMFVSTMAAWDLGYVGTQEFVSRLANGLDTLKRLDCHRGHLYNWYDTRSLEVLEPRYVSTVDSGNLAACLLVMKEGCLEVADSPPFRSTLWTGLEDLLGLLREAIEEALSDPDAKRLVDRVASVEARIQGPRDGLCNLLDSLSSRHLPALDRALMEAFATEGDRVAIDRLEQVRVWLDRIHHHVRAMRRETRSLAPWASRMTAPPGELTELGLELREQLEAAGSLAELASLGLEARRTLAQRSPASSQEAEWIADVSRDLETGATAARTLRARLIEAAQQAEDAALAMDFRFLYDRESHLLHIGYNETADRLDPHEYDLLATEARIASFFAIAKGDVPLEHWFHLGRPLTRVGRDTCLLSWGGSMFEYLMPSLFLRSEEGTLLARSERAAVAAQRHHAAKLGLPWGVSESGYSAQDADRRYRYSAFGVPELAIRRGLSQENVVAPYASTLALTLDPTATVENLRRLEALGMLGQYGFYEAADFTAERVPEGRRWLPVRSYMAHHQGMILTALDNFLSDGALVRRLHADPRIQSVEVLLHERAPLERPPETRLAEERSRPPNAAGPIPRPGAWTPRLHGAFPELHALGNGRCASWITTSGGGGLRLNELALTRWREDPTKDAYGLWVYVEDDASNERWSATRQPTGVAPEEERVVFHPHMAEFHRRDHGIGLRMEVAVAAADDVEIRRITVSNESDEPRTLSLTSYGEVVLAPPADDERHPALSKLFVESEWNDDLEALVFTRSAREPSERPPVLVHRVVAEGPSVRVSGFETDRAVFLGRGGDTREPRGTLRSDERATGWTLDPILALRLRVDLEPDEERSLAFLSIAAGSRESALEVAERYRTPAALDWALADAATEAARQVHRLGIAPGGLSALQTLGSLLANGHAALRCAPSSIAANRLGQSRLWGLGLSGDLPILLVKTRESGPSELLRDLVRAHLWWRHRGLSVDLVVLREGASGYADPDRDRLLEQLRELGAEEWLGRRGGVHFMSADQLPSESLRVLEAASRVVLETSKSLLASNLVDVHRVPSELPPFVPTRWDPAPEPTPPLPPPPELVFANGYGGFREDGSEYVIRLAPGTRTPAPWCNVLASEGFGSLVSEAGLGFTWAVNSGENRLTPWSNDPVADPAGEALFLRDEETAEVWSPTPLPAPADVEYEVRHGIGYTEWRCHHRGLEQTLRVGVAPGDPVKWIRLRLRNRWPRPRRITATYYAEWCLGTARGVPTMLVVPEYDAEHRALLARNPWNAEFAERVAFLGASRDPHGLSSDRCEFLGREGDLRSPAALRRWGLSGRVEPGADPCAVYQAHLDLDPDGETEIVFFLGQGDDRAHALELLSRWREPAAIEAAERETARFWRERLGAVQVRTPDPALDLMVNRWLLYQALSSRVLGRTGFYQSGGAIGFRDQLQDLMAFVLADPLRLRAHLIECAAHQFEEGDVLHWWHPPWGRGVRTRCSDDLLWLPFATAHYVEATGDAGVLDEIVPFLRAPLLGSEERDRYAAFPPSPVARSLFEHCQRALERGVTHGARGLPLIGAGDWNDGMNRVGSEGRGESVWLGWFASASMQAFADLCRRRGEDELEERWRRRARALGHAVEEQGWDGAWYRRAFDDDGRAWGAADCEECRIDSIAQSWAALSGAGAPDRVAEALASAERELVREADGVVRLLWPPFSETLRDPGYIGAYPPGIRENGGQYSHAAAWLGLGFAAHGDGERAAQILRMLNPVHSSSTKDAADRYRVEPYVIAADVGSVPPHVGRGGWTWYTGAAAWTWRLAVEGVLGIRRVEGGVRIAPCLPRDWSRADATVRAEGGTLQIRIERVDHHRGGAPTIHVDGEVISGDGVAFPEDGDLREVIVELAPG